LWCNVVEKGGDVTKSIRVSKEAHQILATIKEVYGIPHTESILRAVRLYRESLMINAKNETDSTPDLDRNDNHNRSAVL